MSACHRSNDKSRHLAQNSPERAFSANVKLADVQGVAAGTFPGSPLADPQAAFGHDQTVPAEYLSLGDSLSALPDGHFGVVEEDDLQDRIRDGELLRDLLVQTLEVQTSPVVAQGLDDELGDDRSHPAGSFDGGLVVGSSQSQLVK